MDFRLTGLVAAAFTPMKPDGTLNLDQVGPLVDRAVDNGLSGLYVCGSTGEGASMTGGERQQTAAAYVAAAAGRLKIVVQVGHDSLATARELAAHARQIGADAISAVSPYYFKPVSAEILADCLAEITSAAPELPFYYYHVPVLTGVEIDPVEVLEAAGRRIPTLVGAKFTAYSIHEIQTMAALDGGRFNILHGRDEMLLSALAIGVRGAIGSTYNFAAPLYREIISAFENGNMAEAQRWQGRAVEMIRTILGIAGFPGLKATMNLVGPDCGPVRLPLATCSDEQIAWLQSGLEAIGFFEWSQG